jgi:hypothetical protein
MKAAILSAVTICLMISTPSVQSVFANHADTEQEAGIGADSLDRPCTYGPDHDECHDQFLERTYNLPTLPPNQYYGVCIETGPKLTCDILKVSIQRG